MECIVLAGGKGTRLQQSIPHLPKTLAPIQGTAFLHILMNQIISWKIVTKVIFAIGYRSEQIIQFIQKKSYPFQSVFSIETKPLGTGGALKKALNFTKNQNVIVMNADSFLNLDFKLFYKQHLLKKADATIAVRNVLDSSHFGQILINAKTKKIESFKEKYSAKKGLINAGIYIFQQKIFDSFPEIFSLEKEGFPFLLNQRVFAFSSRGLFVDIGTPSSYIRAQTLLKTQIR